MERVLLHLAIGAGGGFRAQNLPCSGNGDAALALKPAGCRALRGGDGTFLCLGVWLAEREGHWTQYCIPSKLLFEIAFYLIATERSRTIGTFNRDGIYV